MIIIKLKEAMLAYARRTGRHLTYEDLEAMTGIPKGTLFSIARRPGYHPTVARIEILCRALDVQLHDMLEMIDDPPKRESGRKHTRKRDSGGK
jgi:DNA-binding Xre family transcriptional regulator